ncbi:MAG: peptidoglycan DD-metalloendopeptidase family protein, partial [Acidimicrobiales bacterium]
MRLAGRLLAALGVASITLAGVAPARAQVPDDTTTTTTTLPPEEPVPTTAPAPDDLAPTTTLPPPPPTTTTTTTTTTGPPQAAPTTATATPTTAPAPAAPPAVGGDDAAAPPGALPPIPPELQAQIDSVRRTPFNSSVKLLEALAPLRAMGLSEEEAVQAGFGRFPVGGRATFSDDWWFPRFVPALHLHEGTDIFAPYGTPARSPATGVLEQTFGLVGGLAVYVRQPDGTYFYLAHLSRYEAGQVSGQTVQAGDVVGYVGDSGNARGGAAHIHFEIHPKGGGPVNPKPYLDLWLREALDAVPGVVAATAPRVEARATSKVAPEEQDLQVVGHRSLGTGGGSGDVAVVGGTAVVARGERTPAGPASGEDECVGAATVVDLSDPAAPEVAATIELPRGQRVEDVDALAVRTPSFTGDLAALAVAPCRDGATGLAYYDVSDPEEPRLLGRLLHPRELADTPGAAGACAERLRGTCLRTSRAVDLQVDAAGRVVSLSSATGTGRGASEVYAADVSDPGRPRAIGWFPVPGKQRAATADDCSPVSLQASAPRSVALPGMDLAGFRWETEARVAPGTGPDGSRAYPAVVEAGRRRFALVADDAWWSSAWAVRVDRPASMSGERVGCARSAGDGAQAGPSAGRLVYVGRGCPERRQPDGTLIPADPYLAGPAGRIAVADAALSPLQADLGRPGCTQAARLERARRAGALGLVVAGSFLAGDDAPAADPSGTPGTGPVPGVQLRKPDGDALRAALCPAAAAGGCVPAEGLTASLVELPGQWGGLRILDISNPEAPQQVEVYRPAGAAASSPADDAGSYAIHSAVADGSRVYSAWGADGLRVLDLASGEPVEAASFLPPRPLDAAGAAIPAQVTGVDHTDDHIVVTDLTSGLWVLDKRPPEGTRGYWLATADGGVHALGEAVFAGSAAGLDLDSPVVAMSPSPTGMGYRLATAGGGVYAFGDATFEGSLAGVDRTAPVVGLASTPSGRGYWLVSADGGVNAFGDAAFLGSLAATPPSRPIVAVVASPTGEGYWLVGQDGGVFAFGDAEYLGSTANAPPASNVVGAAATPSGRGYWLASADGGVFAFGDAAFKGSVADARLSGPLVGVAPVTGYKGYWLASADGGVYAVGGP